MPASEPLTVLAFGAHPDDVEFGCGGVIARETQSGGRAHVVICTRGESASHGSPEERKNEAEGAARLMGASVEFIELGADAHLEHSVERVLKLAAMIRQRRPRSVLAPTVTENQHPDHAALGRMVREAARLARYGGVKELRDQPPHTIEHLLWYAVTAEGEIAGQPPLLIDVSTPTVFSAWKAAMEVHTSQLKTRNYVELQLTRARLNGLRAGVDYAIALYPSDPLVFDSLRQLSRSARRF